MVALNYDYELPKPPRKPTPEDGCAVFLLMGLGGMTGGMLGMGLGLMFLPILPAVGLGLISWIGASFLMLLACYWCFK